MLDSKLISKARRSAEKAKIRMACVSCIAYKHRCSDSRPCKSCLRAQRPCVESGNLTSKYDTGSCGSPRTASNNMPNVHSAFITERVSRTTSGCSGLEWAYCEARSLMGMGYRVEFLERFFCCLSASDAQELNSAMVMSTPEIIDSISFSKPQCSGLCEADENRLIAWDSETDAVFCKSMDLTTRQQSFQSNPRNAALFGMRCDEFISRASNFELAIPLCEVDALILLLYRSVHRIRGQQPAVMFLRMYIGASRTGSLIRESLRVENDELHRPKEVRSAALALRLTVDGNELTKRGCERALCFFSSCCLFPLLESFSLRLRCFILIFSFCAHLGPK